jgi:hypothetical protein
MAPTRLEPGLFGFVVSGPMPLIVAGISTFRSAGRVDGYLRFWTGAWLPSWLVPSRSYCLSCRWRATPCSACEVLMSGQGQ